jgi:RNA recognition motif-containing protein
MNIYVGNLSPSTTQEAIRKLFKQYGEVNSVNIITALYSGESRGFGFVGMDDKGAREAIVALNTKEVDGHSIKVSSYINGMAVRQVSEVIGKSIPRKRDPRLPRPILGLQTRISKGLVPFHTRRATLSS